jgi:hypothetical protein
MPAVAIASSHSRTNAGAVVTDGAGLISLLNGAD